MALKVVISTEAEQDINLAYLWYEEQRSGLGDELLTN